jgi:hypothetical protein
VREEGGGAGLQKFSQLTERGEGEENRCRFCYPCVQSSLDYNNPDRFQLQRSNDDPKENPSNVKHRIGALGLLAALTVVATAVAFRAMGEVGWRCTALLFWDYLL